MRLCGQVHASQHINGCTSKVLLPYEECPECNVGKGEGYCGSVSDVYEFTKKEKP